MDVWIPLLLPFMLLLGRISAFIVVLPIFGWAAVPVRIRAGIAFIVTIFFAMFTRPELPPGAIHWVLAAVLLLKEILTGLAMGLAVAIVFAGAQQAGRIIARQMGFAIAQIVDPVSGEMAQPVAVLFEMTFTLFFLVAGGHHLLLSMIGRSYAAFPVAATPSAGVMAQAVLSAGSAMFLFALKLAAPLLAAFMVLSVVLGILARALPEMNILLASFPLRIALGLFMAAALAPALNDFAVELAHWLNENLIT